MLSCPQRLTSASQPSYWTVSEPGARGSRAARQRGAPGAARRHRPRPRQARLPRRPLPRVAAPVSPFAIRHLEAAPSGGQPRRYQAAAGYAPDHPTVGNTPQLRGVGRRREGVATGTVARGAAAGRSETHRRGRHALAAVQRRRAELHRPAPCTGADLSLCIRLACASHWFADISARVTCCVWPVHAAGKCLQRSTS